jgi:UDP-GlcNAc3NAcA epimerase
MVWLIDHCKLVMTDSGGLQKEAYFFEKPCITLRDETEWVELVENGFNILAGANQEKIIDTYKNHTSHFTLHTSLNLYGDGAASRKIIEELLS